MDDIKFILYNKFQSVNNLNISFVKSFTKHNFIFPENSFKDFTPFYTNHNCKNYDITNFNKKDPLTYLKFKCHNLWLYENYDGSLGFDFLRRNYNGFSDYIQPLVLFIHYINESNFILYTHRNFGNPNLLYLVYYEITINDYIHFIINWSSDYTHATVFNFKSNINDWNQYIAGASPYYENNNNIYEKDSSYIICPNKLKILDFNTKLILGMYYPKKTINNLWWYPLKQFYYPTHYIQCLKTNSISKYK